jgi:hypothetical protein
MAVLGCAGALAKGSPSLPVKLTLAAAEVPRGSELRLSAEITNRGPTPVQISTDFLHAPSLVLRVRDAVGKPVPLGPPPVPWKDDGESGRRVLAPGESITFRYSMIFGIEPPPGEYQVSFESTQPKGPKGKDWEGTLASDWVPFRITSH